MPRNLSGSQNELRLKDNLSGGEVVLYYRLPTTKERLAYSNKAMHRTGAKIVFRTSEARQEFGLAILTGFREGDFVHEVDGVAAPLTTADPDWKNKIMAGAGDMVELLAMHVFDAPAAIMPAADEDAEKN